MTESGEEFKGYDILIGADGIWSNIRAQVKYPLFPRVTLVSMHISTKCRCGVRIRLDRARLHTRATLSLPPRQ